MKKYYLIFSLLFILLVSCDNKKSKISEFSDIYYDILLIREREQDTTIANPLVRELLNKYGYDEQSFQQYSMELFTNDRQNFTKIIDSVRLKAERESSIGNNSNSLQDTLSKK